MYTSKPIKQKVYPMIYSQYLRIETKAGGTFCTNREFIRSARTLLLAEGKAHTMRLARRHWLRSGLAHLSDSQQSFIINKL